MPLIIHLSCENEGWINQLQDNAGATRTPFNEHLVYEQ